MRRWTLLFHRCRATTPSDVRTSNYSFNISVAALYQAMVSHEQLSFLLVHLKKPHSFALRLSVVTVGCDVCLCLLVRNN